ncbi:MAG: N-6 DNA methylase [Acidobacteria bacterium]|nr:N-6 DNA methylase [Acidobacteriota bacterium]
MNSLQTYLSQMSLIRRSAAGVKETSYYGTLEALFNETGKSLKPKVRCVINLANKGAGIPDGGLFTPNQFQRSSTDLIEGQLPERGAIEIKGTSDNVEFISDSKQVAKYLSTYRQVLVTNYRDFLLIVLDENNEPRKLERFSIAEDEAGFWNKADNISSVTETENERFVEFLKRVMLHRAPVAKPEDVAWFLASYARDAKARVEEAELSALETIRKALEESLGIKFDGEKGEHFFRSTLVQTLFYGIFSAWVLWHKRKPNSSDKFRWKTAVWELRVPMISVLFEQIATPSNLKNLNIVEVLDWTEDVLNRVVREEFFARFAEDHAVQYFYEPFLQAFDPELRKELGVWYTPEEIVRYMVERVDRVLRTELNLPDGLADESVYVLDPACGTGAYLVEVLKRINRTLEEKGEENTRGMKLKKAVMSRVFGFEILPAPFVVSHLQIGLLLEQLGVGFADNKNERAGVYLTNSLTGWEEETREESGKPVDFKKYRSVALPALDDEHRLSSDVKTKRPLLVIIGNPPYNAFAGVSGKEEQGLVDPYKWGLIDRWGIKKFNLDDLYIRFFRLAERKIAEFTGKGIVCFVSNYSWTSEPSYVVMREKMLLEFDKIWIENMHGNRKITEYAPDGKTSESIFAIQGFSPGIQQGVTISTLVRKADHTDDGRFAAVFYRDDLNEASAAERREHLLATLEEADFQSNYDEAISTATNRFTLRPSDVSDAYQSWPKVNELSEVNSNGLMEKRGGALIDIDRDDLEKRLKLYFDKSVPWEELHRLKTGLTKDMARFDAKKAREKLISNSSFQAERVLPYSIRPFENRWCYFSEIRPLWNEPRPTLWQHFGEENLFLVTRPGGVANPEGEPFYFTSLLGDNDSLRGHAYYFPFRLRAHDTKSKDKYQDNLFGKAEKLTTANLSESARTYLQSLEFSNIDTDTETASLIWFHALAIGYSPEYLTENADGIRQDFPRIPLPANRDDLIASAELGRRVAALLDTEKPVEGVTAGSIRPELRTVGVATHIEGKQFQDDDFKVTAGWGHAGKGGITMPGKGKAEKRQYSEKELKAMSGNPVAIAPGSDKTLDIYLNNHAYWRNVPEPVWNYYIGGYQVIKKWLSYREFDLLGRPLNLDEVTEVTNMIRRIAALKLMESELNANYQKIKANTYTHAPAA